MEIKDFAKESRIPLRTLRLLVKAGIIQNPLTVDDLIGLRFVSKNWANREILRAQLASIPIAKRKRLIETAGISTKWERYVYSRYANLPEDEKLRISVVYFEVQETFHFTLDPFQKKRIRAIRSLVYNHRSRDKGCLKTSNLVTTK